MRFDLNNAYLDIEPMYDDVLIRFKDTNIVSEEHIRNIEEPILELAQAAEGKTVTLDFVRVRFMSSSFLGFLVKLQNTVTQNRGRLRLRNLQPAIFEIFKVTALHKLFTIEKK